MRWDCSITDVPTAGTQVQIRNTKDEVSWIKFRAPSSNTGVTYVGLSDMSATDGFPLGASGGEDADLEFDFRPGSVPIDEFWVDAATNGDDVGWAVIFKT